MVFGDPFPRVPSAYATPTGPTPDPAEEKPILSKIMPMADVPTRTPTYETMAPAQAQALVEQYKHPLARYQPLTFWARFQDFEHKRAGRMTAKEHVEMLAARKRLFDQGKSPFDLSNRGDLPSTPLPPQDEAQYLASDFLWTPNHSFSLDHRRIDQDTGEILYSKEAPWGIDYLMMDEESDEYKALSAKERFKLAQRRHDGLMFSVAEMLSDYHDPNIEDPNFDWKQHEELWLELKQKVDTDVWDDLLDARSEYEARLITQRNEEVRNADQAWGMWYANEAQDTAIEQYLLYPQIGRMGRSMMDPTIIVGAAASLKITGRIAKSIDTMSKLTKTSSAVAIGKAMVAEEMIAMAYTHVHALHRGTTENKDQYMTAALLTGVLAGIPNTYLGVKAYRGRVMRVQRYGDTVGRRQSTVDQLESEFNTTYGAEARQLFGSVIVAEGPLKGARITALTGDSANQWYGRQLLIETEAVKKALAGRHQQIPVDSPEFRTIVAERIAKKKSLLDEIHSKTAEIDVLDSQMNIIHDIDNISMGNTIYKSVLDDIFEATPTDLQARKLTGVELPADMRPKPKPEGPLIERGRGIFLDEGYSNSLGGAQRILFQDEAFAAAHPKLRKLLLELSEGKPHFLTLDDVRYLSKQAPEVLANLDLDGVMKVAAKGKKARRMRKVSAKLQREAIDQAEYASTMRRALPKQVGDLVHTTDGRYGQVIAVSPSGRTVTVDFGFVREKALRASGEIKRPDIGQIEAELVAAKKAGGESVQEMKYTDVESAKLDGITSEIQGKLKAHRKKASKFEDGKLQRAQAQLKNAEGRLESAKAGVEKLAATERLQARPKARASAEQRLEAAEKAVKKKTEELAEAESVLDDLRVTEAALEREMSKVLQGDEYTGLTKEILESRKQTIRELEEMLELERQKNPKAPEVYDVETFANKGGVSVLRADQVASFILDSPMGKQLFPTIKKWHKVSDVPESNVRGKVGVKKKRVTTETTSMVNGFRVTLKLFYKRNQPASQTRISGRFGPKEKLAGKVGSIDPKSKRWRAELTDLDGQRYYIILDEPNLTKARLELAEKIRLIRAEDSANPVRLGELIGQGQVARRMEGFVEPTLAEQVAAGNIPKRFDSVTRRGSINMREWDILDSQIDRGARLSNLEDATFKKLVDDDLVRKNGEPVLDESLATLSEEARATEIKKGAKVRGNKLWRWLGAWGFRGNLMASDNPILATAGYIAFGGGGTALRGMDDGGFVQSGTGMGTIGAGGIVPNRSLMVKEFVGPVAREHMHNLAEYRRVVGKGMSERQAMDSYSTDIIKYRLYEGELPRNPALHSIIERGSEITTRGFDVERLAGDPRIAPFAPELANIKNSDSYVMRARSLPKMKQFRSNVVEYLDPATNKWVPITDGIDFMYHHFHRMLLKGNPDFAPRTVELLSRRYVRMFMSDSGANLRALDGQLGTKFTNAQEFVAELDEIFRKTDQVNIPKGGLEPDSPGGRLELTKSERDTLLKDLGAIEQKLRVTMPRMKMGDVPMQVKMLDGSGGSVEHTVRMHDYFETDLVGLSSRYHTETIAHAGMQAFLREFWTDTWKPTRFREWREAILRADVEHRRGAQQLYESQTVLERQLTIIENALLARPQYSRLDSWAAILHTISNVSVLRALPGFTQAQYPEMHGAIFANGYGKILRYIPVLGEMISDAALGRTSWKQASDYVNLGLGMGMTENILPSMYSKIGHIEDGSPLVPGPSPGQTVGMKLVSETNEIAMSGIPKVSRWGLFAQAQNVSDIAATIELHNALVQIVRTTDPVRRLKLINKFSGKENVRLAQYGTTRQAFDEFIDDLSQDGMILSERVVGLEKTEWDFSRMRPETQAHLKDMTRQWIKYYVQRTDDYSMPSPFITSQIGKLSQQFRQFSWGSNLNHLARSIQAKDSRAAVAVMNQIIGGTLVHLGMGMLRYWNDPDKMKEYLSFGNIIKGIIMRSSFFGMGVDLVDTFSYIATNDTVFSHSGKPMGTQIPALNTAKEIANGVGAVFDSTFGGEGLNKGNYYHIKNLFDPVTNALQFQWFFDGITAELPD